MWLLVLLLSEEDRNTMLKWKVSITLAKIREHYKGNCFAGQGEWTTRGKNNCDLPMIRKGCDP